MNKTEIEMIMKIVDLSFKYGVPVVENIIYNINKEQITEQDIDDLIIDKK